MVVRWISFCLAALLICGCSPESGPVQGLEHFITKQTANVRELAPAWVQGASTPTLQFQGELLLDGEELDLPRDASRFLGWSPDGRSLLYTRHEVGDLPTESVWVLHLDGLWMRRVAPLDPSRFIYSVTLSGDRLLYADSGTRVITLPLPDQRLDLVVSDPWRGEVLRRDPLPAGVMPVALRWDGRDLRYRVDGAAEGPVVRQPPPMTELSANLSMPYVHQVYDTPNSFNGYWACGPTSTLMALCHLGRLKKWPVTVNIPKKHTSDYGAYVSNKYTKTGTTFSRMQKDPSGKAAYGGYGWCTDKGAAWAYRMQDYAKKHGTSSKPVKSDFYWGKGLSDVKKYLKMGRVVVLSTKLTSAGHIVTIKGIDSAGKLVANDPYGDKNKGYMNYKGEGARYSWSQVGTKWFITVYGAVLTTDPKYKASLVSKSAPATMVSGATASAKVIYKNEGTATWDGKTRLATSNPRDRKSAFYTKGSWISANRLAAAPSSTKKGAKATFSFTLTAPKVCKATQYIEYISLVQESKAWFSDAGQGGPSDKAVSLKIKVTPRDADGDGHSDCTDCDDQDKAVHPGAAELCNGKDDDCDKQVDEGLNCSPDSGPADSGSPSPDRARPADGSRPAPDGGGTTPPARGPGFSALEGGCVVTQTNSAQPPGVLWFLLLIILWKRRGPWSSSR